MRNRLIDSLWLLALGIYVVAGMTLASFHGDEAMQIWMSNDYATAFIDREPQRLLTTPPYDIDSEPQLRIINGSVNRYLIGLSWHLAGFSAADLAPRPGWDWGLDYDTNVATDHLPSDRLLAVSRLSSTLFLAFSVPLMFALGWQFGGRRLLAYLASLLYALNPVVLLNGRRAVMEGSMLFFGLLTILMAVIISRRREEGGRGLWGWWIGLILAGTLAVASKHSSIIFVAGAFGWIFMTELLARRWSGLIVTSLKLVVSFVLMFALFIAVSPALWNDPPVRFQNLLEARSVLLNLQVSDLPAAITLPQRFMLVALEPFIAPLGHFELTPWRDYAPITAQIERYMASPLSGLQAGVILGTLLTALAFAGVLLLAVPRWRPASIPVNQAAGLLIWLLLTCVALIANPLPWQRYYLPLIPILILLAGITLVALMEKLLRLRQEKSAIVSSSISTQTGR